MFTVLAIVSQIFIGHVAIMAQGIKIEKPVSTGDDSIRQIRIPGDLILGGVFPVHAKGTLESSCGEISETRGVHRVEAMLYAMDTINEKSDFLRGYKLGALILDSCSNPSYALNQSLDFVRDMIGSTDVSEYQCNDGNQPLMRSNQKKKVVAVVGGSYSSVTVQVANLLRLFRIAQVSPASTNADLSDKSRFEYLARTVPSDNFQAQAMVDIASHFGWTYVSLVFSADEYGELGADAFKKEARRMNICIATEERISSKNESLRESVENLIKKLQPDKDVGARVVVLFVGTEYIPQLMNETAHQMNLAFNRRRQKQIIWLASESWDRNNEAYTDGVRRLSAEGAIVLMLESRRVPAFEDYYLSLHPGSKNFERNGWLKELWKRKFNCEFGLPVSSHNRCEEKKQSKESFNPDDKIQFVIDAVYAIAHGLQEMKFDICPNDTIETSWISRHSGLPDVCSSMKHIDGEEFYKKYLLNVKFKDLADTNFHFTPEGDGPARYTILNYQPSMSRHVDRSDYVVVGKWAEDKLYVNESLMFWNMDEASPGVPISQCSMRCKTGYRKQLIKADELCCWACSKCEDYEYLVNETTCADCGVGRLPNPDRKSCFYIKDHDLQHMQLNSWYSIIPSIFAVIGIVITLIVIIIFAAHNDTPVVKASGRELSYILLISIILCYSMTFVLIAPPTALTCALKRTGISFSFSCVYSAILVKTNRIYRIFSSATRSAKRPGCISPISQVLLTAMLASIQLIASLIWLFIVPPGTRYKYPTRTQVVLTCRVDDVHFLYSLTFAAILLILCTVYAVQTRQVPENFNETKYVGFSMYTTCVVWVSCICFLFGTANNFQIQITSLCISISMSANVVLVCIFAPKLYIIIFEKHKNVRKKDGDHSIHRKWNSGCSYTNALTKSRDQSNGDPTAYTALLADQRRRNSRKFSQPSSKGDVIKPTARGFQKFMTVKMVTEQSDRYADLEKELQYFKEMYEMEKETNELNEIKLAELNSLNAQDLKKHEHEKLELQAKLRRLENAANMQRTNDTANAVFRQRIQQLELEVSSLTDRVRIAENMATKLEEDCRAKDFKIREQQKEYDICLSKCNALELMLMSNSQMDNSISINSATGDHVDGSEGLQTQDYVDKHSPNTDTTCDTVPDSPINSRAELKHTENSPYSLQLNGHDRNSNCTSNFQLNGFSVSLPEFVDVNVARNFCQQHPNSIDGLLKLAEMIRTIRNENHVLKTSISLDGVGRTPLAVLTGKDKVKDLQRLLAELNCRPNA